MAKKGIGKAGSRTHKGRVAREIESRAEANRLAWARRHPGRAAEERTLRKAQAHAEQAFRHKANGTVETHARAARTRQGAIARLHQSGAIDDEQLAAAALVTWVYDRIARDVTVRTASMETRVDRSPHGKAFGGMRSVATVIQTASGATLPWPTVDETGQIGEIVAENQPASAQDVTFGITNIGAYKWSSKIFTLPFELLQDQGPGMDVEAFVRRAAATRIGRAQNAKYTVGTGTNEPTGIVTSAGAGKVGTTGQTLIVTYDDMVDLEHSVDPAYRSMPGVSWMFHDNTLRNLKKLKDSQGHPLWLPGLSAKDPDTFLRYKYTINQDMPQMAANAKSILFGDLSQFLIRDVMEVTLFRFDDSAFIKNGQIGFLAWARGDGRTITAGAPIKYYQNSAT